MNHKTTEDHAVAIVEVLDAWFGREDLASYRLALVEVIRAALESVRASTATERTKASEHTGEREAIVAYILSRLSGDAAINGRPASNVLYEIVDAIEGGDHLVPEAEAIHRWHKRMDRIEHERAEIVKWLRKQPSGWGPRGYAESIERGDHLSGTTSCICAMLYTDSIRRGFHHTMGCPLRGPEISRGGEG